MLRLGYSSDKLFYWDGDIFRKPSYVRVKSAKKSSSVEGKMSKPIVIDEGESSKDVEAESKSASSDESESGSDSYSECESEND